jgi:multiple sugar transport system substrate-binding protein
VNRKVLCLVTAALLTLGTAACKNAGKTDNPASSMKYVEEELGAVQDMTQPGSMQLNSAKQLVVLNAPDAPMGPSAGGTDAHDPNAGAQKTEFFVLGADGRLVKKIACDLEGQVSAFTLDTKDNLYIVCAVPGEKEIIHRLYVADPGGNVQQSIDLAKISYDSQDDYKKSITGMAADSNGNVYFSRMVESVLQLDKDGKEKGTLGEALYAGTVQTDADDNILLYGNRTSDYKNVLQKYNPATGENLWTAFYEPRREEGISIGEASVIRCDPEDGSVYLLTADGIEKFDANGKHLGKALDFKEYMILASGLRAKDFCIDAEKTIWLMAQESRLNSLTQQQDGQGSPPKSSLFKYSLKQASDDGTVQLTLSVPSSNRMIDVAVSRFNKENPGYRMTVQEAGDPKRRGSYDEQYINTLSTELMSGLGPDILSVGGLPYEKYAAKGMLADLTKMIREDKAFNADDYYANVFDAMKEDGKLFVMPASISGIAMLSNRMLLVQKNVPFDPAAWTWDDFGAITGNASYGSGIYAVPPDTGNILLMAAYQRFIDVANKKASFDNGEFEKMLEMAKGFGMDNKKISNDGLGPLIETAARGKVMFSPQVIGDFMLLSASKAVLDGEFGVHNMPGADESQRGGFFNCNEVFAINGNSRHGEKAWNFIKILLSDEIQSLDELKGFPVSKKALSDKADRNNKLLTSEGMSFAVGTGSGDPITPVALSKDEVSQVLDFVDGLEVCCHMDNKILGMIQAETEGFFTGKKSAAEVAKALQQKVSLYLGE